MGKATPRRGGSVISFRTDYPEPSTVRLSKTSQIVTTLLVLLFVSACSTANEERKWPDTSIECFYSNWTAQLNTEYKGNKLYYLVTMKDDAAKQIVRESVLNLTKTSPAHPSFARELSANTRRRKYGRARVLFYNKRGFKVDELFLPELVAKETVTVPRWSLKGNIAKADFVHSFEMPIVYESNDSVQRPNIPADAIKWEIDVESFKPPLNEPIAMEGVTLNMLGGHIHSNVTTTWIDDTLYYKFSLDPDKPNRKPFDSLCAIFKSRPEKFNLLFADANGFELLHQEIPLKDLMAAVDTNGNVVSLELRKSIHCTEKVYENIRKWNVAYPGSLASK